MIGRKTGALFVAIALVLGSQFNNIYVPEGFDQPLLFRAYSLIVTAATRSALTAAHYGFGTESANVRLLLGKILNTNLVNKVTSDETIEILDRTINGVNIRVYSPKTADKLRPAMVYIHGGGYTLHNFDIFDKFLVVMAVQLNMVVLSVDYKLTPEFSFPSQTNECIAVTTYLFENAAGFGVDSSRIIMAGDSAGGNAVASIAQQLSKTIYQIKLQVLIYPWLQSYNMRLPSAIKYSGTGLLGALGIPCVKYVAFYMGVSPVSAELAEGIAWNNHTLLIADEQRRAKLESYLDYRIIPMKYREGRSYYLEEPQKYIYPKGKLQANDQLRTDAELAKKLVRVFDSKASPSLADPEKLVGLPPVYMVVLEWDELKDEGLIYSERLKAAGVQVEVAFYDSFHGVFSTPEDRFHLIDFKASRIILNDMIRYIKKNV